MASSGLRLDRTLGPLVVNWIERQLVHGPGDVQGQPIELDDEQVRFIFHAYAIDDAGRRLIRRAVFSRPKGRAKSELAAMIACAEALGPVRFAGWGSDGRPLGMPVAAPYVPCVATEEGQADNTYNAVEFMLRNGAISALSGLDVGMTRTFTPDGGKIAGISSKAGSKDGGRETFVVFDETHLYVSEELKRLHSTIRRNLAKRKKAEPWSLETSTMYAPGEESVAESSHLYAEAVKSGKLRDNGFLFDHREGPSEFDFGDDDQLRAALVEAYGAASDWMDMDRMISEARDPQTEQSDFIRYFLNRPVRREKGQWIKPAQWSRLAAPEGTFSIPPAASACLGMDGSRTYDTTVVGWAARSDDGRVDVDARIFSVRRNVPHHVLHGGGQINFEDVEEFVIDRFGVLRIEEAAYDPRYLDRSAEIIDSRLPSALIVKVEPQSKNMRDALMAFERGVVEGVIRHRGDEAIAAHVDWAGVDRGESNEVRRVFKIDRTRPIDAVIAMSLAYWRVTMGAGTSVYEQRGLLVVGPDR